jgi:hypothetical protein
MKSRQWDQTQWFTSCRNRQTKGVNILKPHRCLVTHHRCIIHDTHLQLPSVDCQESIQIFYFTLKRDKDKEKDHSVDNNNKDKDGRPSEATILTTPSSDSSSFINVTSNHTFVPSQQDEEICRCKLMDLFLFCPCLLMSTPSHLYRLFQQQSRTRPLCVLPPISSRSTCISVTSAIPITNGTTKSKSSAYRQLDWDVFERM